MKKDIRKIKIENDFFGTTTLDLFAENTQALLVYGANGTGKTTIGKAVLQVKEDLGELSTAEIQNEVGHVVPFTEEEKDNIHVFNDDFIENQVSFKSDKGKMNAIVMFGKSIDNEKKISELNEEIEGIKKKIVDLKIEKYEDPKDSISPLGYYEHIKKTMSADWADEEKNIRGIANKPSVKQDDIDRVTKCTTASAFVQTTYDAKKEIFSKLLGNPQQIFNTSLSTFSIDIKFEYALSLLKLSFDRPVGTEIANRISETIKQKGLERIEEIKESFKENFCPYCFRDIKEDYVSHIIEEINKAQNESIKKHIENLKSCSQSEISIDLNDFKELDKEACLEIENDLTKLNKLLNKLNTKIIEKISNPYEAIEFEISFDELLKQLNEAIKNLELKRIKYNEDIKNKTKLKQELQSMNYERIAYNLSPIILNYNKQQVEQNEKKELKTEYEKEIIEKNVLIAKLNAESENIGIALTEINNLLGLIFLSKDRLSIEAKEDKYHVKVRNKLISLKKLSNGEKNAIALCYFFVVMNKNCSEDDIFKKDSLIVLDDPLSSFDYNNKVGIYAFLRKMLSSIVQNENSRVVILTHQIETFFDMIKIFDDIQELKKKKKITVLKNKKIENYDGKPNVYKNLLKEVYESAKSTEPLSDDDIENLGNKLRKVLEAFSTFTYGCGIDKLSTDSTIISEIKDPNIRKYLENSLYKISLNTASHFEERTYSLIELLNISYFERDGLIRSVKDSLLLIYLLNKNHIMKILEISDTKFFDDYMTFIKAATTENGDSL